MIRDVSGGHEPPPVTARGVPKTGAWENGAPDTEKMRQGQFTSPWTGQEWSSEDALQSPTSLDIHIHIYYKFNLISIIYMILYTWYRSVYVHDNIYI